MLVRPGRRDARLITYNLAQLTTVVALAMLVPAVVGLVLQEWDAASAFLLSAAGVGAIARYAAVSSHTRAPLDWSHGMVTVALTWLVGSAVAAIPLYLSGHWGSFGHAWFEAMSGLTTTGLSLVQDLDHTSRATNLWRHILHVVGGQGTVVVAVTLFTAASGQASEIYGAGGRRERVVPDVRRTAQRVAVLAGTLIGLGTVLLTVTIATAGVSLRTALLDGWSLAMSAADTGGFAPRSTSVAYYHSPATELVLVLLMIAGALAFAFHRMLWEGRRRAAARHLELRVLAGSLLVLGTITLVGLERAGTYGDWWSLLRKGVFSAVSAHTTTGLSVVDPRLLTTEWGVLAPAALVGAMAVGGMFGSSAGGMKTLRVGLLAQSVRHDVRKLLLPDAALVVTSYELERRHRLTDTHVRATAAVVLLFLISFLVGGLVGLYEGEEFTQTVFESVSATANGGLSSGVLHPGASGPVQTTLFLQMWFGRLEFMAVFALMGYLVSVVRGRA